VPKTLAEVLAAIAEAGGEVVLKGEKVALRLPEGVEDLVQEARKYKADLAAFAREAPDQRLTPQTLLNLAQTLRGAAPTRQPSLTQAWQTNLNTARQIRARWFNTPPRPLPPEVLKRVGAVPEIHGLQECWNLAGNRLPAEELKALLDQTPGRDSHKHPSGRRSRLRFTRQRRVSLSSLGLPVAQWEGGAACPPDKPDTRV